MNIGRFEIELLSEGIFEAHKDGVFKKINSADITGKQVKPQFGNQPATVGINPILIRTGKQNILLDTGLGWGLDNKSKFTETSNLLTNLDIFGLTPADITHVVLTHLHFDHAAGSTYVDYRTSTQPTLPNANYFVQKVEWYYALEQLEAQKSSPGAGYELDELYKLAADDKLVMITEPTFDLLPGIKLMHTGGHTPGHQVVKIEDAGQTAYFLGDLVPSEQHLNHYGMQHVDVDPLKAKKVKTLILRQAAQEKALLLFYHSVQAKAGTLRQNRDKKFILREVNH